MSTPAADDYVHALEEVTSSAHTVEPEAALTRPLADFLERVAKEEGVGALTLLREAQLEGVRPDFAASLDGRPCGWVELKAPGHSVDGATWTGRERKQWQRLAELDSLLVTNGAVLRLYQLGVPVAADVALPADVDGGYDLKPLVDLLTRFAAVRPPILTRVSQLAERMAPLARLLRERIRVDLEDGTSRPATQQAKKAWVANVHERATDDEFASDLAQVIAYSLAIAALRGDGDLNGDGYLTIAEARTELKDRNAVLAAALGPVLEVDGLADELSAEIGALERLASVVDAAAIAKSKDSRGEPWLWFYEDFLAKYDPEAREKAGVYYTPTAVVQMQVRHIDYILRTKFKKRHGFSDKSVTTLDPCVGSGTYPLSVLDKAAEVAIKERGAAGPTQIASHMTDNLVAFELLPGPYSVAHLRIGQRLAEMADALFPPKNVRVYLTNTLDDPEIAASAAPLWGDVAVLATERERARNVKKTEKVTVVLGNPPYGRGTSDVGRWVVNNPNGRALFSDVIEPAQDAKVIFSAQASLYDLYVYFWRWALWKAFENAEAKEGVVSFITASSWLRGPAFLGLRNLVLTHADEVWITDLGGDGRENGADENVFAIQSAVAVVTVLRRDAKAHERDAKIYYQRVTGTRAEKLDKLTSVEPPSVAAEQWVELDLDASGGKLVPASGAATWRDHPLITDLMPWQQPGCKYGRTWPIGPAEEVIRRRWFELLKNPSSDERGAKFVTSRFGRNIQTSVKGMRRLAELEPEAAPEAIVRYGYRSFDRQYALKDPRVTALERPALWATASEHQIYLTGLLTRAMGEGPALTVSAHVPDLHHFSGRGGKDVIPLYRDAQGERPNVVEGLLTQLHDAFGRVVTAEDFAAYIFAVLAHPRYFETFRTELETPGLRVPLTRNSDLFFEGVKMGASLLWLQTYAERFTDPENEGRSDDLPSDPSIKWTAPVTALPAAPDRISYDSIKGELLVGDGVVSGISEAVWNFSVSGWPVLQRWLGHRTASGIGRAATRPGPLDRLRPEAWDDDWNVELLELLNVLNSTVANASAQGEYLSRVLASEMFTVADLPVPNDAQRAEPSYQEAHGVMLGE